jgi:hypothetical protein
MKGKSKQRKINFSSLLIFLYLLFSYLRLSAAYSHSSNALVITE